MPFRKVHNHEVILTREEDLIYQKILTASRKALSEKRDMEKIFVHLLRLRQVCCHASLTITEVPVLEDGIDIEPQSLIGDVNLRKTILDLSTINPQIFDQKNQSTKMQHIIDGVTGAVKRKEKSVVVSQWTKLLDLFMKHFERNSIRCQSINGSVNIQERTNIVEDFNCNLKGPPVIFYCLKLEKNV